MNALHADQTPNIDLEFGGWADRHGHLITSANYYDMWQAFLAEEYNDQEKQGCVQK